MTHEISGVTQNKNRYSVLMLRADSDKQTLSTKLIFEIIYITMKMNIFHCKKIDILKM